MGALLQGASAARLKQLRIGLGAITLLLAALVLAKSLGPVLAEAQAPTTATVTGIVYADRNGNDRQDADDQGLGGWCFSSA